MTKSEMKDFLAQFKRSENNIKRWPKWMRDQAVMASASLPKLLESVEQSLLEASNMLAELSQQSEAPVVPDGWMDIKTAPKDATVVDILRGENLERLTDMRRVNLGKGNVFYEPVKSGLCCVRDAVYWMPPPPAPQPTTKGEE